MHINRRITLPMEYEQCRKTGRIDAFDLAWKPGRPKAPHLFWDSDVAKWIEAAAYSLATYPDPALERRVDGVIDRIVRAQQTDGYLNTYHTIVEPTKRWTNLRDNHELYCAGHLIEAAVAYHETTGKRTLLDAVSRYADYIGRALGRGTRQKRGYPGHQEIELALIRLYRATNENRYLDLARYFIDERGRTPHYFDLEARARGEDPKAYWPGTYEYNQSHLPVRKQTEVVGHAVRAMYLYSGMIDTGIATGDRTLITACKRLWKNAVRRRMHITGGIGPLHSNEGFTADYDLPNEGAYLETCAAIGLLFWARRMLSVELNGEYADVMERALYNGTISGLSHDGRTFFYGNPLAAQPGFDGNGRFVHKDYHYRRSEWFGCACCPPNIARMIAQFPTFLYASRPATLVVHHYAASEGDVDVANQTVRIEQKTRYPWNGRIDIGIQPERTATWTLALRIPGWSSSAKLHVNGKPVNLASITRKGYARIKRAWCAGDRVRLDLPMPVERVEAHPAARQNCGRVALQRGPVVYCLEQADNGPRLSDITLPAGSHFTVRNGRSGILAGIPLIHASALRRETANWSGQLYSSGRSARKPCRITAIPYFLWANRDPGEMLVWTQYALGP
ncbi:MAG: glycoside hydrolase family 127 protein [Lentisphaerae bacterium]|nr:glycoside hydrolase family 127 protein [Lentisphaerota bacterium]